MQEIEQRLLSRFKWGLSADLQMADLETRIAILNKKMYADGIELPSEVVEYLAYSISNNIRELEGALISLIAQSSLNKKSITLDLAKQMIDKFVKNTAREVSIEYIQKVVCDYFDLPIELMKSKTRKREVVQARQIAMYFSKKMTKSKMLLLHKYFETFSYVFFIYCWSRIYKKNTVRVSRRCRSQHKSHSRKNI